MSQLLETDRLVGIPITLEDYDDLYRLNTDPDVAKRVYANCFHRQELIFLPRRMLWKTEQTQIEFVKFEERRLGKKRAPMPRE